MKAKILFGHADKDLGLPRNADASLPGLPRWWRLGIAFGSAQECGSRHHAKPRRWNKLGLTASYRDTKGKPIPT